MKHKIRVDVHAFAQSIKDAAIYASKEDHGNGTNLVLLSVLPKVKKLSIIACDGFGYYESRLNLECCKKQPKPTLPGKEMRLGIALADVSMLVKFIPARLTGNIQLEVDDEQIVNDNFSVVLSLPTGLSTTFFSKAQLEVPDLGAVRTKAEKGKKKAPAVNSLHILVRELLRAGKVFPGKDAFAQMFTSDNHHNGVMALLECKNAVTDISVIFMLQQPVENAA